MDNVGQNKRKLLQNMVSHSSRKLLKGDTGTHSCSSATEVSPLTDDRDLRVAEASQVTHANELAVIPGATYEINQKNLPPDAPVELCSIRAILLTEVSGQHITVNYPSVLSLQKYFAKADHVMDVEQCTPTLQLGSMEPRMGTKPELDEKFVMSPRTARRVLTRPISCKEYLHHSHLKSFWVSALDSKQNSEAMYKLATAASSASDQYSDAFNESLQNIRKDRQPISDMKEEQVTQDLCNFPIVCNQSPKLDVTRWKSASNSPNGMDQRQSGLTTEEDDSKTCDAALVTVKTAAELLTQLTHTRKIIANNQLPGITSARTYSSEATNAQEEPIRWGIRKKVSYDSRRSADSCELSPSSGLIHRVNDEKYTTVTSEPDRKVQDTYDFTAGKWESLANVVASDSNRQLRSSVVANGYTPKSPPVTPQGQRDRQNKSSSSCQGQRDRPNKMTTSSRAAVNILKLPKDMQGRWSCERYKSAQLKLIDIMHARKAAPGNPILRPALREEARKHIGDTGLLDHLLKHMTDTVVSTGERFRRRHNSEGAMEYWLEHASLMDLRRAAGVEDPSWIPPPGWKPGDKLLGRHWQMNRGMTPSEAAEMMNLKETVEKLKSEMKVLCGRIKGSNQKGEMDNSNAADQNRLQLVSFSKMDEDLVERMRKDMTDFRAELTTLQGQFDEEPKSRPNLGLTLDRFQKLESEVQQISKDRKSQQDLSFSGNKDLEGQLQDVRKAVTMMQADVSCIMRILGFAPPPIFVKATPIRHVLSSSSVINPLPLVISTGDDTCSTKTASPEPRPPGTSTAFSEFASTKPDVLMRQCSGLKSVTSSSNGGITQENHTNNTDEEISRALSNYTLVHQSRQTSNGTTDPKNPSASSMETNKFGQPVATDNQQKRSSLDHTLPQHVGRTLRSGPTGFKPCRPPGSFIWPSMVNLTPSDSPSFPSTKKADVQEVRVEDGLVTGSPPALGASESSAIASYVQSVSSARSIAESQVAATMAGMFGCMAPQPSVNPEMQVLGSTNKCVFLPRMAYPLQRSNYIFPARDHTGSTGLYYSVPPPRQMQAQTPFPIGQARYPASISQQEWLRTNKEESPPTFPTLPLAETRANIDTSGTQTSEAAAETEECPSSANTPDAAVSLSLSLTLGSSTPSIHCGKAAPKQQ